MALSCIVAGINETLFESCEFIENLTVMHATSTTCRCHCPNFTVIILDS